MRLTTDAVYTMGKCRTNVLLDLHIPCIPSYLPGRFSNPNQSCRNDRVCAQQPPRRIHGQLAPLSRGPAVHQFSPLTLLTETQTLCPEQFLIGEGIVDLCKIDLLLWVLDAGHLVGSRRCLFQGPALSKVTIS